MPLNVYTAMRMSFSFIRLHCHWPSKLIILFRKTLSKEASLPDEFCITVFHDMPGFNAKLFVWIDDSLA